LSSSKERREGKIALPHQLVDATIDWYNALTGHGGITRVRSCIESFFWFPNLRVAVEDHISTCDACQRLKDVGPVQSEARPRNETSVPWSDVAVDLIGTWKVQVGE
jgi:hypothetical protein